VLRLSGGVYTAAMFAGVTQFERVDLLVGGTEVFLALGMPATSSGTFAVIGTAGNDRVIAAAGETARVGFNPGAGSDRFLGGDGDDQINMAIEDLDATDIFNGNAGRDRIGFTSAGTLTAAQMSGLSNIETFSLANGNNTIVLGTNLPTVNVAGRDGVDVVTMGLSTQYTSLAGGDDTMIVSASTVPALSSYGGTGIDTIRTVGGGTFSFGPLIVEFERLVMQDPATVDLTANLQVLTITGSAGEDIVSLGAVGYVADFGDGNDKIVNGDGNDVLDGGAGFDVFILGPGGGTVDLSITGPQDTGQGIDTIINFESAQGGAGDDVIYGDDNPNILNGAPGDDLIFGLGADDVLWGAGGNDIVDGGSGEDTAEYRYAAGGIVVNLAAGSPQVSNDGDGGQDTLISVEYVSGSQFDDTIDGDAGNNYLRGNGGNDIVRGGDGDDRIDGGGGNDVLDGQGGTDLVLYASAATGVTVDLSLAGPQNTVGAGIDTLSGFENLTGSIHDDQLFGDSGANVISGGAGNDVINGGAGRDTLYGGAGNDTLQDNDAIAQLFGEDGDDIANLSFQSGTLSGTVAAWILMGNGADTLNLVFNGTTLQPNRAITTGTNTSGAGTAPDAIEPGDGNDTVNVTGAFTATGTYLLTMSGDDLVSMNTNSAFAYVHLGAGNDIFRGGGGADTVYGGSGDDLLEGGPGNDLLDGQDGTDTASYESATGMVSIFLDNTGPQNTGGAGTDTLISIENLVGSAFADQLFGNSQANVIRGGAGNDYINGGAGNDQLYGDAGNDTLQDNDSFAYAQGGDGDDTGNFSFSAGALSGTATAWMQMGDGADTLNLTFNGTTLQADRAISTGTNADGAGAAPDAVEPGDGNDTVNVNGSFTATGTYLLTMSGNDTVNMNSSSVFAYVHLGAGNDRYNGNSGNDVAYGGAGNDTLYGNAGDDLLDGGLGDDTIDGGGGSNDTVSYSATATSATGGVTVDLSLSAAQNTGGAGIDTIFNMENVIGTDFADTLLGNAQVNRLEGGAGDDILAGRAAGDTIVTGAGNDLVRWYARTEGGDTVTDFVAGGTEDAFSFLASAFPLFNGQSSISILIDASAGGDLGSGNDVIGRTGVANAASVDSYLAGAVGTFAGGVFVLGQAAANGTVSLYYDPNAAAIGGSNAAGLLATLSGNTSLAAFAPQDFLFFS